MVDVVSTAKRSEMMAGIKGKNTKPELVVRKALYASGIRYRLHSKEVLGRPDVVIRKHKVLIFVHGCFWHGHKKCSLYRLPKSNTAFWKDKIGKNRKRDKTTIQTLLEQGWRIVVIWECALKGRNAIPIKDLVSEITAFLCSNLPELEMRAE